LQRLGDVKISSAVLATLMPFPEVWIGVEGRDELVLIALSRFLGEDVKPKQAIKALVPFLLEVEADGES
jgi:hypothetical protein